MPGKAAGVSRLPVSMNILTDPWIPLWHETSGYRPAALTDLLTGAADAEDLGHPREDIKIAIRSLLSALLQTLLAPQTLAELQNRIEHPLQERELAQLLERKHAFELFPSSLGGQRGFLQTELSMNGTVQTSRLFPDYHRLFGGVRAETLCPTCAIGALHGCQAWAICGGQGYSPSIRGSSHVTTLVRTGSVRRDAWAGVLCKEWIDKRMPDVWSDRESLPWVEVAQAGAQIGILDALLWPSRSIFFEGVESEAPCPLCMRPSTGQHVRVGSFKAGEKTRLGIRHPHSPIRRLRDGRWMYQRISSQRPVWTGLAEMLMYGSATDCEAAPVVEQYLSLYPETVLHLVVYSAPGAPGKAVVMGRFSEEYSLSMARWRGRRTEFIASIQRLVADALAAERVLLGTLQERRNAWVSEAAGLFWELSEDGFWAAVRALENGSEAPDMVASWHRSLEANVLRAFDRRMGVRELSSRKMGEVARRRRLLRGSLRRALSEGAAA